MSINFVLTKENIDYYLLELSKELLRLKCKHKIEIILVGGSSILVNYSFRTSSLDIDAYYKDDILKQAISNLIERLDLPVGWMNNDFLKTPSFTFNIIQFSEFYKEFSHILSVRTITKEYLIAMKLISFRIYKNDLQDINGIILEDKSITLKKIKEAVINLYGNYNVLKEDAKEFIERLLK